MRTLILALDALEYNLVEKFDLKNLKQEEYGKVEIPRECFIHIKTGEFIPTTPLVWASFLTGKLPEEHNVTPKTYLLWKNSILNYMGNLPGPSVIDKIKEKFFYFLGFKKRHFSKRDYRIPTIFDLTKDYIQINTPVFDPQWTIKIIGKDEGFSIKKILKAHWNKSLEIRKKALNLIGKDWNLFMVYTRLLDIYGELAYSDKIALMKVYNFVDKFAKEIKEKTSTNIFYLIVSDHGITHLQDSPFGTHSEYGFYSSNIPLKLNKPKITDFYKIIREKLKTRKSSYIFS